MAKRRRQVQRRAARTAEITPESHISLSVTQMITAVIGIGFAVLWGGYVVYGLNTAKGDIAEVKVTTAATAQVQDTKREQLGKDFLASNKEIAARVSDLHEQLAIGQTQAKTTNETLAKISDQLSHISVAAGAVRGR